MLKRIFSILVMLLLLAGTSLPSLAINDDLIQTAVIGTQANDGAVDSAVESGVQPVSETDSDEPDPSDLLKPSEIDGETVLTSGAETDKSDTVTNDLLESSGINNDSDTPLAGESESDSTEGDTPPEDVPVVKENTVAFEIYEKTMPGQGTILYGRLPDFTTLSELGATSIIPYYSFDGDSYIPFDYMEWMESGNDSAKDNQCFFPTQEPYKSFVAGDISKFYVKLGITGGSYAGFSTVAVWEKKISVTLPQPLPDSFEVYPLRYPNAMKSGSGFMARYQYCITVKQGATVEEIAAMLPATINMEAQIFNGQAPVVVEPVECPLVWNLGDISTEQTGIVRIENPVTCTLPEAAGATIDGKRYIYKPVQTMQSCALVLTVVDDSPQSLALKEDVSSLIFSMLKPSGASSFRVEYSLDGGRTWTRNEETELTGEILNEAPGYSNFSASTGLTYDCALLSDLEAGKISGFNLRLYITGGVLEGYTQAAAWPGDYVFVKPNTGKGHGSVGNRGDQGNDNLGAGGIRDDRPDPLPENDPGQNPAEDPSATEKPDISSESKPSDTVSTAEATLPDKPAQIGGAEAPQNQISAVTQVAGKPLVSAGVPEEPDSEPTVAPMTEAPESEAPSAVPTVNIELPSSPDNNAQSNLPAIVAICCLGLLGIGIALLKGGLSQKIRSLFNSRRNRP